MTQNRGLSQNQMYGMGALLVVGWTLLELDVLQTVNPTHLCSMLFGAVLYGLITVAQGARAPPPASKKKEYWDDDGEPAPAPKRKKQPARPQHKPIHENKPRFNGHKAAATCWKPSPTEAVFEEALVYPEVGCAEDNAQRLLKQLRPAYPDAKLIVKRLVGSAHTAIHQAYPDAKVFAFGSAFNGFGEAGSDVDATVLLAGNSYAALASRLPPGAPQRDVAELAMTTGILPALQKAGFVLLRREQAANGANVAVLADPTGGPDCLRMRINDVLPMISTKLLRQYSLLDRRTHEVILLVKQWAAQNGMKHFCTYALTNMVLFYMQTCGLLPSLQMMAETPGMDHRKTLSWAFEAPSWRDAVRNLTKMREDSLAFVDAETCRTMWQPAHSAQGSCVMLLHGFCHFYAKVFNWETEVVSLRLGARSARQPGCPVVVEDPVEPTNNLTANVDEAGLTTFVSALRSSAELLENAGSLRFVVKQPERDFVQIKKTVRPGAEPRAAQG
mmetsp:Transcript_83156/g.222233  ORF Transcript_83156/g.222233 Transcript_83156/m.222233 type:complete len:501 (+) Transcript_83156:358-1860(+)